jgi:hypothetical protein
MSIVITLVHGTRLLWLPRRFAWTKESSPLSVHLRNGTNDRVVLRRFEWSGANSPSGRSKAAKELQKHLHEGITEYSNARHFLIAHSHGGNVALYALRDSLLRERIDGLVCLSTPFLYAHQRDLGSCADEMLVFVGLYSALVLLFWFAWNVTIPRIVGGFGCLLIGIFFVWIRMEKLE